MEIAAVTIIVAVAAYSVIQNIRASMKERGEAGPSGGCGTCSGGVCGETPNCEPGASSEPVPHPGPRPPQRLH